MKREHMKVVDELNATHHQQIDKQQMDFEGAKKVGYKLHVAY